MANYGQGNINFSLGIGWGALNKYDHARNKLIDIDDVLAIRESHEKYFVEAVSRDFLPETTYLLVALITSLKNYFYLKLNMIPI